jgi:hypothetical protein
MSKANVIMATALASFVFGQVPAVAGDELKGKTANTERSEKMPPKKQNDCEAVRRIEDRERLRKEVDKQIECSGKGEKGGVHCVIPDPFNPWASASVNANKSANKAPEDTARKLADPQR